MIALAINRAVSDRISPSVSVVFDDGAYFNAAQAAGNGPAFTITVLENNDLATAPTSSPLTFDYVIEDEFNNNISNATISINVGGGNTFTFTPPSVISEGLQDSLLRLSLVVRDAAGNPPQALAGADSIILGRSHALPVISVVLTILQIHGPRTSALRSTQAFSMPLTMQFRPARLSLTVLEPNDLSGGPAASLPLEFDYTIADQHGNTLTVTGLSIPARDSTLTVTADAGAAVPSALEDGTLTLSVTVRDPAANTQLVLPATSTIIRGTASAVSRF